MPLSKAQHGKLSTTRDEAKALLTEALRRKELAPHIAIETYTWPVLSRNVKKSEQQKYLIDGIAAELRWVQHSISITVSPR